VTLKQNTLKPLAQSVPVKKVL